MAKRNGTEVRNIGGRRELFIDDYLIDDLGGAEFRLHHPVRQEVVLRVDAPWENSNSSSYHSVVQMPDGRCRFYYSGGMRSVALCDPPSDAVVFGKGWILCLAESDDGIHWSRPAVNLYPEGPNVILDADATEKFAGNRVMPATAAVTLNADPAAPPERRWLMLCAAEGSKQPHRLYLYGSADGVRFAPVAEVPAPLPVSGNSDSQNTVFYDAVAGCYRIYHRIVDHPESKECRRFIAGTSTTDFIHFTADRLLEYDDGFDFQLYTNQISPYPRAPHLLMGFPMRYIDNGRVWDMSILNRPNVEERASWCHRYLRHGTTSTDSLFMVSRDGVHFTRYPEAFVRPGPETTNAWAYGDAELAYGWVVTPSTLGHGAPDELSFYVNSGYRTSGCVEIRRCTLRLDGFVSLHAGAETARIVTRPLIFEGGNLMINVSTSAWGRFAVGILDEAGSPIPGYELENCYGGSADSVDLTVRWRKAGGDLRPLAGRPVRLAVTLLDGDLYALRFAPYAPDPKLPPVTGQP